MRATAFARRSDPETSHEAAASLDPDTMRRSQKEVYQVFHQWHPAGITDLELVEWAGRWGVKQSPSGLRTRRRELVDGGLLRFSGEYKKIGTRRHRIWELTPLDAQRTLL